MFRFLERLWNWLKARFRRTPPRPMRDATTSQRRELADADYERLLMGLFEEVARGATAGGLRGWLYGNDCEDKKLARWLTGKSEEWLQYSEDYRRLGRDLAALAEVATGDLGQVARRISLELSDAVGFSASEGQTSASEGELSASEGQTSASEEELSASEGQTSASEEELSASKGQTSASEEELSASEGQTSASEEELSASEEELSASEGQTSASEEQFDEELAYNQAWDLIDAGKYTEALVAVERMLQIKPNSYKAWNSRGSALGNLGRYEEALESFDKALEFKPDFHLAWNSRGIALDKLGRYEEAIESYDKALEFKPDDHQAWNNRGVALGKLGHYEEAIESYDKALEFKPDYHLAWTNRGNALDNLGRNEEAIESYNKALEFKPDFHLAWNSRGNALDNLGRYEEAIESYDKALEFKPDDHEAWNNRGVTLANLGRYEEAIESYDKALEFKPDYHEAWNNRGVALANLGHYEEAIESYDKALEFKSDYHEAWNNRGNALDNLGHYEEAIESYDKALEFKHDFHEACYNLGTILANLERYEEAIESYNKALEFKHDYYEACYNLGAILDNLGRYEEALESLNKALKFKPDFHQAWHGRGVALANLGRYEEAIESYNKALEFKPDYYEAWNGRGIALAKLGYYEEAIESYNKVLEFKPDLHQAWTNRATAICSISQNRISTPNLLSSLQRRSIVALKDREPHIFALREALPHLTEGSPSWGQIYLALGSAYLEHSRYKENASPYWRDAIRHYQIALPILTAEDFPEDHLKVLQGLIRAHLSLREISDARFYQQQGRTLFEQLRARKPDRAKPAFESQFSSFSHLEIDLLIEENHPVDALEQAEFYKNRCLTWILDRWQETPTSPDFATMQSSIDPQTAMIYWYLSEDNLTTFIITSHNDRPSILDLDRRQQKQRFETWMKTWNEQYRDYAGKKESDRDEKPKHPWRVNLVAKLAELEQILQIDRILDGLPPSIERLILIPHRDLHRFPLHHFFLDRFICTYLPSVQVGRRFPPRNPVYAPLLSIEDPKTDQKPMPCALLESAIVRHLAGNSDSIVGEEATLNNVLNALKNAYSTLHFTGHGAYNSIRPEASALALSGELLTAKAIGEQALSSYYLVCLAACETALTGTNGITTEYVGLPSAFLKAGAGNVLSTLWPVPEASSAWFMIRFYQYLLTGDSPSLALKQAQYWLKTVTRQGLIDWLAQLGQLPHLGYGWQKELKIAIEEIEASTIEPKPPYADPFFWAAFTLAGREKR